MRKLNQFHRSKCLHRQSVSPILYVTCETDYGIIDQREYIESIEGNLKKIFKLSIVGIAPFLAETIAIVLQLSHVKITRITTQTMEDVENRHSLISVIIIDVEIMN